jgi:hypothetical protein
MMAKANNLPTFSSANSWVSDEYLPLKEMGGYLALWVKRLDD